MQTLDRATLFRSALDQLKTAFARAAEERDLRPDFDPVTQELGWVLFEREVMTATTNRIRAERGLSAVEPEAVLRAEWGASGHIDYASKYALGCAELTIG